MRLQIHEHASMGHDSIFLIGGATDAPVFDIALCRDVNVTHSLKFTCGEPFSSMYEQAFGGGEGGGGAQNLGVSR